jgi:hypothetical protein
MRNAMGMLLPELLRISDQDLKPLVACDGEDLHAAILWLESGGAVIDPDYQDDAERTLDPIILIDNLKWLQQRMELYGALTVGGMWEVNRRRRQGGIDRK